MTALGPGGGEVKVSGILFLWRGLGDDVDGDDWIKLSAGCRDGEEDE